MTEKDLDGAAMDAAKQYMGGFAWPTVVLGLFAAVLYFALPFFVSAGFVSFWVAAPVMAVLTYVAYTGLHESVHGSISGSQQSLRWVNEFVGYTCGLVLGIPMTAHRHEHLAHHRHTNDPGADPDFVLSGLTDSPASAVKSAMQAIMENYRYYLKKRWPEGKASQNRAFCLEIVASISVRVAVLMLTDPGITIALFILAGIGGTVLLGFLFAYLVHYPYEDEGRYVDTATIVANGPFNAVMTNLWLYQNYHSIHHLFPRVPFFHYRKLFETIEPIMGARGAPVYRLGLSGLKLQKQDAAAV
ncbi:MAG: fatty acid desaturase [Halieaceae bacterium]